MRVHMDAYADPSMCMSLYAHVREMLQYVCLRAYVSVCKVSLVWECMYLFTSSMQHKHMKIWNMKKRQPAKEAKNATRLMHTYLHSFSVDKYIQT